MITKMESKKRRSSAREREVEGVVVRVEGGLFAWCCTRMLETKHDASEAEGPSSMAKEKRVESLRVEGGGGERLRIHWLALNQTKSKNSSGFLVAMQPSKWAGNLRARDGALLTDIFHFLKAQFRPRSVCIPRAWMQAAEEPGLRCAPRMKRRWKR